jgi:amidohydrolase
MIKYLKKQTLTDADIKELIASRRHLHAHPELGYQEFETSKLVAQKLREFGYDVKEGVGKTGVVGILKGSSNADVVNKGKTLMIRADMDALSLQELNDCEYKSKNQGVMHACGHDGHTAIELMLAKKLVELKDKINGTVKCIFQPAEEGLNGANAMDDDGVMENPKVDNAIGLHLFTDLPIGKVAVTDGGVMASVDEFHLKIIGKGGHGASPHMANDPIVITANIINAMQTIVSRNIEPIDSAVVTFGTIHSGTAFNIIPETVELSGTIRTFSQKIHDFVKERFISILEGAVKTYGIKYELSYEQTNIPTVNDPEISEMVRTSARELVGETNLIDYRTMGGEDMSVYLNKVPGCFFFVGASNEEKGITAPHHNPHFDIDEDCLIIGYEMMMDAVKKYFDIS